MDIITGNFVKNNLPYRPIDANKGTMGTLLNISGSYSMAGACILSSLGALRSGVGLLKVALPKTIYPIVASAVYEAVYIPYENYKADYSQLLDVADKAEAVLIGCGLGLDTDTVDFVSKFVREYNGVLLIDADGINAVSRNIDVLKETKAKVVLTPHPKEMSRLIGIDVEYINRNREQVAYDFAKEYGVVLVLKGKDTVVSDGTHIYVNKIGNSGMAKGGSGDVLSGVIASLMAQKVEPFTASLCGVYIHSRAGDIASEKLSKTAMLPSDIVSHLPDVYKEFET